jgi:hypothetical protein
MENSCIENPNSVHMLWCPSTHKSFLFKKTKILIFGGILKFLELIVFEQILVDLGSFRQFWAMAMPKLHLKS